MAGYLQQRSYDDGVGVLVSIVEQVQLLGLAVAKLTDWNVSIDNQGFKRGVGLKERRVQANVQKATLMTLITLRTPCVCMGVYGCGCVGGDGVCVCGHVSLSCIVCDGCPVGQRP